MGKLFKKQAFGSWSCWISTLLGWCPFWNKTSLGLSNTYRAPSVQLGLQHLKGSELHPGNKDINQVSYQWSPWEHLEPHTQNAARPMPPTPRSLCSQRQHGSLNEHSILCKHKCDVEHQSSAYGHIKKKQNKTQRSPTRFMYLKHMVLEFPSHLYFSKSQVTAWQQF